MGKEKLVFGFLIAGCIAVFAFKSKHEGLTKNKVDSKMADTTSFLPNTAKGWTILSSYLKQHTPDSVEFELILKQDNSITWATEQFIGTITNKDLLPKKIQKLSYDLYKDNTWSVRITTDGLCYLNQAKGEVLKTSTLPGSPFVLPVKVRYKNN
jgi:hypothetical protein